MKFHEMLLKKVNYDFIPNDFLEEVARNEISVERFGKWLSQDYEFVKCALRFMNILSSKSPDKFLKFFSSSIYYISMELSKFEEVAERLGINLNVERNFICSSYCNFLISLAHSNSFFVGLAAFYGEEKAYYEAWKWVKENVKSSPYMQLIEHWSSPEFKKYVEEIEEIIDEMAEEAGKKEKKIATLIFIETNKFEKLFWESV